MKHALKLFAALTVILLGFSLSACGHDDDDDQPIPTDLLPSAAKAFLNTYYPSIEILSAEKDNTEYEVVLKNGHQVDFNLSGEWIDVDAPLGDTIPSGFYPSEIDTYVATLEQGGINEISKTARGYEVELVNGLELLFDSNGTFYGYDR